MKQSPNGDLIAACFACDAYESNRNGYGEYKCAETGENLGVLIRLHSYGKDCPLDNMEPEDEN